MTVANLSRQRKPLPFAVDLLTNKQVTWTAMVEGLRDADLAHLLLHAYFDDAHPGESAFLLSYHSHLFLRDVLDSQLDRLRLIVLSACQSGLGDVRQNSEEAVSLLGRAAGRWRASGHWHALVGQRSGHRAADGELRPSRVSRWRGA